MSPQGRLNGGEDNVTLRRQGGRGGVRAWPVGGWDVKRRNHPTGIRPPAPLSDGMWAGPRPLARVNPVLAGAGMGVGSQVRGKGCPDHVARAAPRLVHRTLLVYLFLEPHCLVILIPFSKTTRSHRSSNNLGPTGNCGAGLLSLEYMA